MPSQAGFPVNIYLIAQAKLCPCISDLASGYIDRVFALVFYAATT